MSKPVSVSLSPSQQAALAAYKFAAKVADNSKALREIMRAGLETLAAGTDPTKAAAARAALTEWDREPNPKAKG